MGAATGATSFGTESYPATGNGAAYVTVEGDFNNYGKMDLAVANVGSATVGLPISNGITLLLGNGDGTFSVGSHPRRCRATLWLVTLTTTVTSTWRF